MQHEAFDNSLPIPGADHQREVAGPEFGETHLIVCFREVLVVAGDQVIRTGAEIIRCRQLLDTLPKIAGGS